MRQQICRVCIVVLILAGVTVAAPAVPLTPAQKKELKVIGTDAGKVSSMISKKKFTEAATAIQNVEDRLATFITDVGLKETDTNIKTIRSQIEKLKKQLARATEKASATFEKSVASIFAQKCVECHGDEPKGGLRLDTFSGLEKGGKSGGLIAPGEAESSLLIQRLIVADDALRMPLGNPALTEAEIHAIGNWISEGANFDGDKTATMASLAKSAATSKPAGFGQANGFGKTAGKAPITKETGNETVHFMQDVMPEMVDTCGRCHNDKDKRSGLSVMSFEKLMKGGDSGAAIVPGSLESSRLWRLVNADETPVMPMGNQTGITRKWHANLRTWILEGAKFDGADPKKAFPTLQEREAEALTKFTPEQWLERRKQASETEWKKVFPNADPNRLESGEYLLYGDVAIERLAQIEKWANEQAAYLRQTFKIKGEPIWRGKLAIFVLKDRFGYEEFNNSVHRREVPREIIGHVHVTASMEDALIAVQDIGDAVSETSPGMRVNLTENITGAYFKRSGQLPDWLTRGAGLALARQKNSGNQYLAALPRTASRILHESNLAEPQKIFDDGTFSPAEVGPIGYTVVEFLLRQGNLHQFDRFVQQLQNGAKLELALESIYRTDGKSLAEAYVQALPGPVTKGKK
jgi:uncharacterized membrane protein